MKIILQEHYQSMAARLIPGIHEVNPTLGQYLIDNGYATRETEDAPAPEPVQEPVVEPSEELSLEVTVSEDAPAIEPVQEPVVEPTKSKKK